MRSCLRVSLPIFCKIVQASTVQEGHNNTIEEVAMTNNQTIDLRSRVYVRPAVRLCSFTRRAADIPRLAGELSQESCVRNDEELVFELNGSAVGFGKLEFNEEGVSFVITRIIQEKKK
jgi:hypothetical protein